MILSNTCFYHAKNRLEQKLLINVKPTSHVNFIIGFLFLTGTNLTFHSIRKLLTRQIYFFGFKLILQCQRFSMSDVKTLYLETITINMFICQCKKIKLVVWLDVFTGVNLARIWIWKERAEHGFIEACLPSLTVTGLPLEGCLPPLGLFCGAVKRRAGGTKHLAQVILRTRVRMESLAFFEIKTFLEIAFLTWVF